MNYLGESNSFVAETCCKFSSHCLCIYEEAFKLHFYNVMVFDSFITKQKLF